MKKRNYVQKAATAIFLVYSITCEDSFREVQQIFDHISKEQKEINWSGVLIGNKVDFEEERVVLKEEGEKLAQKMGVPFLETSAKNKRECR